MIDISPEYLELVAKILREQFPFAEVRAFGSRITGKSFKFSDLDLVLVCEKKIDWRLIEKLKDAFSESDLPFMVDVIDWNAISVEFKQIIEQKYEILQKPQE